MPGGPATEQQQVQSGMLGEEDARLWYAHRSRMSFPTAAGLAELRSELRAKQRRPGLELPSQPEEPSRPDISSLASLRDAAEQALRALSAAAAEHGLARAGLTGLEAEYWGGLEAYRERCARAEQRVAACHAELTGPEGAGPRIERELEAVRGERAGLRQLAEKSQGQMRAALTKAEAGLASEQVALAELERGRGPEQAAAGREAAALEAVMEERLEAVLEEQAGVAKRNKALRAECEQREAAKWREMEQRAALLEEGLGELRAGLGRDLERKRAAEERVRLKEEAEMAELWAWERKVADMECTIAAKHRAVAADREKMQAIRHRLAQQRIRGLKEAVQQAGGRVHVPTKPWESYPRPQAERPHKTGAALKLERLLARGEAQQQSGTVGEARGGVPIFTVQ